MNFLSRYTLKAALLGAAVAAAPLMRAEQLRFTLPYTAQFNGISLPAGEYRLTVPSMGESLSNVLTLSGNGKAVSVIARPVGGQVTTNRDYFTVLNADGKHTVSEFVLGPRGRSYYFSVPKSVRSEIAKRNVQQNTLTASRAHSAAETNGSF